MKNTACILVLFCAAGLFAQEAHFYTGSAGSYSWNNSANWWTDSSYSTPLGYVPGVGANNSDMINLNGADISESTTTIAINNDLKVRNVFAASSSLNSTVVYNQAAGTTFTVTNRPGGNVTFTLQGDATTTAAQVPVVTYNNRGTIIVDGSGDIGKNAQFSMRGISSREGNITMNLQGNDARLYVRDSDSGDDGEISLWNATGPDGSYTLSLHAGAQAEADKMLLQGKYANLAFSDVFEGDQGFGNIDIAGDVTFKMGNNLWEQTDIELTLGTFDEVGTYELVSIGGDWIDVDSGNSVIDSGDYKNMFRRVIVNGTEYTLGSVLGLTNNFGTAIDYRLDMDADSISITVIPEPATLGMMTSVGCLMLLIRRLKM